MKRLNYLFFLLFGLLIIAGCEESNPIEEVSSNRAVDSRSADTELQDYVQSILAFREQVHQWRDNPGEGSMSATEAIEKTEIVFNMLLGNPTTPYQSYTRVEEEIPVFSSENWSNTDVVSFYDQIKSVVSSHLGESGELFLISVSDTYMSDDLGQFVVYLDMHIGTTAMAYEDVPDVHHYNFTSDVIWSDMPDIESCFIPTSQIPCTNDAANIIGSAVNREIAVYNAINAGPGIFPITGQPNNTPLPGKVVSRIVFGDHSLTGGYPNNPIATKVYEELTLDSPDLRELYYVEVEISPDIPTNNCLDPLEMSTFILGNLELAQKGSRFVPNFNPPIAFLGQPQLVCTGVGTECRSARPPGSAARLNIQEHPTRHYFGTVKPGPILQLPDIDFGAI